MLPKHRRFISACAVPFLCVFGTTLVQNNAIFALDGMINHTATDFPSKETQDHKHSEDHLDTCIKVPDASDSCHPTIQDGPFAWDTNIEALINLILSVGCTVGTLMSLYIYDFVNIRCVFSISLAFAGFINIMTPAFANVGGYHPVVIYRFFTGLYTGILFPGIPVLINNWFLKTELCQMNVIVFTGMEFGRIFFSLTGAIIEAPDLGWGFLYHLPGGLCMFFGFLFFVFVTDDPLDNSFISTMEKKTLAEKDNRKYVPNTDLGATKVMKYKKNLKFFKKREHKVVTPWLKILRDPVFLLSLWQFTCQSWASAVMTFMVKKYVQEIHGYSVSEAAVMATIPTNISQIFVGYSSAVIGDMAVQRNVSPRLIRRISGLITGLAVVPFIVMPFLPCSILNYRISVVIIQIIASFRVVGNLAGYTTFRELSPTFTGHLFGLASVVANLLPWVLVPLLMGVFTTSSRQMWQYNFITNSTIMLSGNLLYVIFVKTEQASWDPFKFTIPISGVTTDVPGAQVNIIPGAEKPYGAKIFDVASLISHDSIEGEQKQS